MPDRRSGSPALTLKNASILVSLLVIFFSAAMWIAFLRADVNALQAANADQDRVNDRNAETFQSIANALHNIELQVRGIAVKLGIPTPN